MPPRGALLHRLIPLPPVPAPLKELRGAAREPEQAAPPKWLQGGFARLVPHPCSPGEQKHPARAGGRAGGEQTLLSHLPAPAASSCRAWQGKAGHLPDGSPPWTAKAEEALWPSEMAGGGRGGALLGVCRPGRSLPRLPASAAALIDSGPGLALQSGHAGRGGGCRGGGGRKSSSPPRLPPSFPSRSYSNPEIPPGHT